MDVQEEGMNFSTGDQKDFWRELWEPFFGLSVYGKFFVVLSSFLCGYVVIGLYNYYFITLLKQQLSQLDAGQSQAAVETIISAANRYTWGGGILVAVLMVFVSITSFLCVRLLVNLLIDMNERLINLRQCGSDTSACLMVDALPAITHDEIGDVAHSLNHLVSYVQELSLFRRTLEGDQTPEDIYYRLADVFRDRLKLDCFAIWEVSDNENTMKAITAHPAELSSEICQLNNSEACRACRTGEIVNSARYNGICPVFPQGDTMSHCCVPMRVDGKILGVVQFLFLYINSIERKQNFLLNLNLAQQYLREALPLLYSKRLAQNLHEIATRDALTGLYNRRFIENNIVSMLAGIQRRGTTLGILMCDMDYFKQVNDEYGHEAGDRVLVHLATILQNSVRSADMIIRYGGEEFLILLIDCEQDMSFKVAEKIRQEVETCQFRYNDLVLHKTISIGISEYPADSGQFWEAIKFADVALYAAKDQGRNKVLRFTTEMWGNANY